MLKGHSVFPIPCSLTSGFSNDGLVKSTEQPTRTEWNAPSSEEINSDVYREVCLKPESEANRQGHT